MTYKKGVTPYIYFIPVIAFLIVFLGYPLIETFRLAFTHPTEPLGNFLRVTRTGELWKALRYTLVISLIVVPAQLVLALALALFINMRFRGYLFLLYIISIPLALSDVSAALMSYSIFSPSGYINKILLNLGMINTPIYFFGRGFESRAFWVIVITEIWRATPLVFVIILAGLQSVNKEYLEAADVFGFSRWTKLRRIILPILKPAMLSALLIRTLFAFQIFGVAWLLTGRDIPILAGEAYYWQSIRFNSNVAASYGLVIAVVSIIISWIYLVVLRSKEVEGARA